MNNLIIALGIELFILILFLSLTISSYKNLSYLLNTSRAVLYKEYSRAKIGLDFNKFISRKKIDYTISFFLGVILLVIMLSFCFYHAYELVLTIII